MDYMVDRYNFYKVIYVLVFLNYKLRELNL